MSQRSEYELKSIPVSFRTRLTCSGCVFSQPTAKRACLIRDVKATSKGDVKTSLNDYSCFGSTHSIVVLVHRLSGQVVDSPEELVRYYRGDSSEEI